MNLLMMELDDIELEHADIIISAQPREDNIYEWVTKIKGPLNTPYEGGIFTVELIFTEDYPFQKPGIKFLTKIYHPNINTSGSVCVDVLSNWNHHLRVHDVLFVLYELLAYPNIASQLQPVETDQIVFNRICREWVRVYAK